MCQPLRGLYWVGTFFYDENIIFVLSLFKIKLAIYKAIIFLNVKKKKQKKTKMSTNTMSQPFFMNDNDSDNSSIGSGRRTKKKEKTAKCWREYQVITLTSICNGSIELEEEIQAQKWKNALTTCHQILERTTFSFDGIYHFYCGFIQEKGFRNFDRAEKHYKIALQIENKNERYIRYYARIARRLQRYDDSEQMYLYGLSIHSNNQCMRYEYAYLLWMAQKYQASLEQLKTCLEYNQSRNIDERFFFFFK
ncbi:hypothetical protein RFI_14916 [Reticulomyxa filosa]|uniref:Uncharacterized protein n=1 Tax=Reticulomyxa filosa TaxID=46433 RepID=X6N949_RETFI|nr:hypothetical protein RFI_14916 [Reticulomyxa filosa]|eukprot:ETO22284.1 hypothetical protein RFI_14916 [Reticulomyxa filosa]